MKKIRVLMIDDNVALTEMVKEYFKDNKRIEIVDSYDNGADGIRAIIEKENDYDIVLLDLIMPKKDGIYVLQEMKKRNISKNVIVATSNSIPSIPLFAVYITSIKSLPLKYSFTISIRLTLSSIIINFNFSIFSPLLF